MSRALLYTVNDTVQSVPVDGTIALGNTARRFGCNINLSGNAIQVRGDGYYTTDICVTAIPSEAGTVTATLYKDGIAVPGATASATVATADTTVTLPILPAIRESCCNEASSLTVVLSGVASSVTNVTTRTQKV